MEQGNTLEEYNYNEDDDKANVSRRQFFANVQNKVLFKDMINIY